MRFVRSEDERRLLVSRRFRNDSLHPPKFKRKRIVYFKNAAQNPP